MTSRIEVVNTAIENPFTNANNFDVHIGTYSQAYHVQTGNGQTLTIVESNIGIGTTSPTSTLNVTGNCQSSNIFSKRVGINRLDVRKITTFGNTTTYIGASNTTTYQIDGIAESNNNVFIHTPDSNRNIIHTASTYDLFGFTSNGMYISNSTCNIPFRQGITLNCSAQSNAEITTLVNTDTYPLINTFNNSHNDIALLFDAYSVNNSIKSSTSFGNFIIKKESNNMNIYGFNQITPTANLSLSSPFLSINSNGYIGIGSSNPQKHLVVNGDASIINKLYSRSFNVTQLVTEQTEFSFILGTSNNYFTSSNFSTYGGTLIFDIDMSLFINKAASNGEINHWILYNIRKSTNNAISITFSNNFTYNYTSDPRAFTISKVVGNGNTLIANSTSNNLAADTYYMQMIVTTNTPFLGASSNYLSVTVTELPI